MAAMSAGLVPDSMIEDTNAAKPGAYQPLVSSSSGCKKSKPYSGWPLFSMRPYMCTPQPVQAYRCMAAEESTIFNLLALAVTSSLSRGTTAIKENTAPLGFQHLVQPQTWLNATLLVIFTVTGADVHLHLSVPPEYD